MESNSVRCITFAACRFEDGTLPLILKTVKKSETKVINLFSSAPIGNVYANFDLMLKNVSTCYGFVHFVTRRCIA